MALNYLIAFLVWIYKKRKLDCQDRGIYVRLTKFERFLRVGSEVTAVKLPLGQTLSHAPDDFQAADWLERTFRLYHPLSLSNANLT
jgi:hypothetical protein